MSYIAINTTVGEICCGDLVNVFALYRPTGYFCQVATLSLQEKNLPARINSPISSKILPPKVFPYLGAAISNLSFS